MTDGFAEKTRKGPGDCLTWAGASGGKPGGQRYGIYRGRLAHRVAYERATGKRLAPNIELDHVCENTLCVNPDHLQPLSRKQHAKVTSIRARERRQALVKRSTVLEDLARAASVAEKSRAPNTVRAYKQAWRLWEEYASERGLIAYPVAADAMAAWIGWLLEAGYTRATIRARASALAAIHRERGDLPPTEDPRVRKLLRGVSRTLPRGRQKKALTVPHVRAILLHPKISAKHKAVVVVGFVTGMRRSELAALRWSDVEEAPDGLLLHIPRSKTDQTGKGEFAGLPRGRDPRFCPVRILTEIWGTEGRVFDVCAEHINYIVKGCVERIGEDPSLYGAHSLRAGLATHAAEAGVSLAVSMAATRHRSAEVAASYVRPAEALQNAAFRAAVDALSDDE